jgi:hypothetical protein
MDYEKMKADLVNLLRSETGESLSAWLKMDKERMNMNARLKNKGKRKR